MDQGLAAILGAVVGVVGTLGTAVFTYAATRSQTRDAGMVEHGHWIREKRLIASSTFLETLAQVEGRVHPSWALHYPDRQAEDQHPESFLTELTAGAALSHEQANVLEEARAGFIQFGPDRLVEVSSVVVLALRSVAFELDRRKRQVDDWRITEEIEGWVTARKAFRAAVRDVMETPPRRRRTWLRRAR